MSYRPTAFQLVRLTKRARLVGWTGELPVTACDTGSPLVHRGGEQS